MTCKVTSFPGLEIPEDVVKAALTLKRWAVANNLSDWSVAGIGPHHLGEDVGQARTLIVYGPLSVGEVR